MNYRYFTFLFVSILQGALSFGQIGPFRISGHVMSSEGDVLPNVNILLDGEKAFITDIHGDFTIQAINHGAHILRFTYIGYDTLITKIDIHGRDVHLDIKMKFSEIELNEVVVLGDHFKTGRVEQSQTVQSVDADFIKNQNAGTLINSIQKIPGISAINTGVGIAKPVIRGMSFNRILVMDKGIKQEGQQWGADHGLEIDQFDPEKLEIVKGPSSLLYGSDAIGGAIRILPPILPATDHLDGEVFLTYKSNNQLFGASANLEGARNDKFFKVRFSTQDFGDYRVPANSFIYNGFVLPIYNNHLKNTAGNERNASLSLGVHKSWGATTISISNFHQKAGLFPGATGIPREYQLEDDGNSRNIDLPRQEINHFKIISNTTIVTGKDWLEFDLGYQYNDRKEEGAPHAHGYRPTPDGNLALGLDLQTASTNIRYNSNLGQKVNSIIGFQGQWQENQFAGFEFLLSSFRSLNAGVYAYEEFTPSHEFSMNAGLRYDFGFRDIDKFEEPYYNSPDETETVTRNPDIYREFHDFSAALGFSYYPGVNFNSKLNIGTSFRMPTPNELSSNGVHHGTFRYELGDPGLTSERGIQADLNITFQKKKLYLLITPYVSYYYDYIYLKPTSYFAPIDQKDPLFSNLPLKPYSPVGSQIYQYTQHDAFFSGFEFDMEYEFVTNFKFNSAAEYVWNKNLETRLPLPFTPPFSIYGEVEYYKKSSSGDISAYQLSLNYHYFSAQNRVDRNEMTTPGYDLVTVSGGFDYSLKGQTIQIRLSIHNLMDKAYMNHLSRYRLLNLPEQGRNIVFSAKVPFGIE